MKRRAVGALRKRNLDHRDRRRIDRLVRDLLDPKSPIRADIAALPKSMPRKGPGTTESGLRVSGRRADGRR
jgi:hypothetical protein